MSAEDSFLLKVRAVPNAKKTEIVGMLGDAVKIKAQAVPDGGKANREIESFLAKTLGLPKQNVVVQVGEASRDKLVRISGITQERAREILGL